MPFQLGLKEGKLLVKLARNAVEEYLKTGTCLSVPKGFPEELLQPCGVFVTITKKKNKRKELRGCIGQPYPTLPLAQATIESAISSAAQDPRFHPVSLAELDDVFFEVSVLTPPEEIEVVKCNDYPTTIKVGQDGLIVERGMHKGLLLPQVPVEWQWDEQDFLCQCCLKAGLPPDSWLMNGTRVYKFQAIVFEEEMPRGDVKRKVLGGQ